MSHCITLREIAVLTSQEVENVQRSAESKTSDCTEFYKQIRSLESSVIHLHKLAVYLAKQTNDLEELCEIWKRASEICDSVLKLMKCLKDSRPDCGASTVYDTVLDYKNAAFKRYQLNLEALQWKEKEMPAGLFQGNS